MGKGAKDRIARKETARETHGILWRPRLGRLRGLPEKRGKNGAKNFRGKVPGKSPTTTKVNSSSNIYCAGVVDHGEKGWTLCSGSEKGLSVGREFFNFKKTSEWQGAIVRGEGKGSSKNLRYRSFL